MVCALCETEKWERRVKQRDQNMNLGNKHTQPIWNYLARVDNLCFGRFFRFLLSHTYVSSSAKSMERGRLDILAGIWFREIIRLYHAHFPIISQPRANVAGHDLHVCCKYQHLHHPNLLSNLCKMWVVRPQAHWAPTERVSEWRLGIYHRTSKFFSRVRTWGSNVSPFCWTYRTEESDPTRPTSSTVLGVGWSRIDPRSFAPEVNVLPTFFLLKKNTPHYRMDKWQLLIQLHGVLCQEVWNQPILRYRSALADCLEIRLRSVLSIHISVRLFPFISHTVVDSA